MLYTRFQIFIKHNIRIYLSTIIILFFCVQSKAQPNPNQPLRVLDYTNKIIYGVAPTGSEIRLYYATAGSPCLTAAAAPFKVIQAVEPNYWYYSTDMDAVSQFSAPVIVSYIKPGTTTEVFESRVLSREEFQISPNDCSGIGNISMFPSLYDPAMITWENQRGEVVGSGIEIVDQPAGTYTMRYTNRHGCAYRSEPLTIGEATPVVEDLDIVLSCNESSRAVQGQYIGTGVSFIWERQDGGTPLANDRNITLTPGRYYFSVQNRSGCWSRKASVIVSSSLSAARIDDSRKDIKKADCGQRNGHILGINVITVNNQPASYKWFDSEHTLVGTTLDIPDLPADVYTLEVYTPGSTCPVKLENVEVEGLNAITLSIIDYTPHNATCGISNGAITGFKTNATSYRWIRINPDNTEVEVSTDLDLIDAAPGFYVLELKNDFNCIFRSREFHVQNGGPAIALLQPPIIVPDECNLGKGTIRDFNFNTRIKSYTWKDGLGNVFSQSAELNNLRAGTYTVTVATETCDASYTYTVTNNESNITPPLMADLLVCAPSDVLFSFKETAAIYRIYDAGGQLLAERNDPNFRIKINQAGSYFATLGKGTCESPRTEFKIDFGASGLTIPSAFSPNGDGENDQWIIKGIDTYTDPEIKIFNRNGSLVYHSKGPSAPFDGKNKGADLPVGVYYYIVKISQVCPAETGSVMIIR